MADLQRPGLVIALGLALVSCRAGPDPQVVAACDAIQAAVRQTSDWIDGGDPPELPAAELARQVEDRPDLSRALSEVARVIETRGDEAGAGSQAALAELERAYAAVWKPCKDNSYPIPIMPDE